MTHVNFRTVLIERSRYTLLLPFEESLGSELVGYGLSLWKSRLTDRRNHVRREILDLIVHSHYLTWQLADIVHRFP